MNTRLNLQFYARITEEKRNSHKAHTTEGIETPIPNAQAEERLKINNNPQADLPFQAPCVMSLV